MNEALKLALIGVGGYFLYEYFFGVSAASTPVTSAVGPSTTSIAPSGVVTTSSAPATNASGQVAKFAASGALMTSSQWNYYQNLDNPGGNIILGGPNVPSGNISYAQWQAAFNSPGVVVGPQPTSSVAVNQTQPAGVTAVLAGLGHIINLNDLPIETQLGWGVGDDEFEYGLGRIMMGAKPGAMRGFSGIVDAPENNAAYIDEGVFIEAAGTDGGLDSSSQDFYLAAGLPVAGLTNTQ